MESSISESVSSTQVLICMYRIHRRRKLLKAGGAQEVVINFELFAVKLFSIINFELFAVKLFSVINFELFAVKLFLHRNRVARRWRRRVQLCSCTKSKLTLF